MSKNGIFRDETHSHLHRQFHSIYKNMIDEWEEGTTNDEKQQILNRCDSILK